MPNNTNLPPHDINAEMAVLGCILFDKCTQQIAINTLEANDFYNKANAEIYEAIKEIVSGGAIVDIVTLKSTLESRGSFEAVGGRDKLADIATFVSTSANFKEYIKIIQDMAYRRRCITNANDIAKFAQKGDFDGITKAINGLQTDVVKTDDIVPLPDALVDALRDVEEFKKSGKMIRGVTTGFKDLDFKLGGLQESDLIILAGRPAMGKTAIALDITKAAAKQFVKEDKVGVIFSLEMSSKELALRLYSSELMIPGENFTFATLTNKDYEKMQNESEAFEKNMNSIFIDDGTNVKLNDMNTKCHNIKVKTGKDIGLIVVDYIQLMRTGRKESDMNREMTEISRGLKLLAKKFNCPVLALSQLSRGVESRQDKRPMLSDLRDSGAIEQDADVVIFMYRDEYYNPETEKKDIAEVIIAKNRDGSVGCIDLIFMGKYTTFKGLARG